MKNTMHKRKKWILLSVLILAVAAVSILASDSDRESSATPESDYLITLGNTNTITPANPAVTITNTTITFTTAANGQSFTIIQTSPSTALQKELIFQNGVNNCTIVLHNINITPPSSRYSSITLQGTADVKILLSGTNTTGPIQVSSTATVTIDSASGTGSTRGSLTIYSNQYNASIGGYTGTDTGTINIRGGTVTAYASANAAIGGGSGRSGGTINITGGNVNVTASSGAGIGGGNGAPGGTITIGGNAVVTAIAKGSGAAIGGGGNGAGGTITITDNAVVTADSLSTNHAAGIGGGGAPSGTGGAGGIINILGYAVVTASAQGGAAIGGGSGTNSSYLGAGADITISSGATIKAWNWSLYPQNLPAIHAKSVAGSGNFVNVWINDPTNNNFGDGLNWPIPPTLQKNPYSLRVYAGIGTGASLMTFPKIENNFRSFAFQFSDAAPGTIYTIYAEALRAGTPIYTAQRVSDSSNSIPSVNSMTGYGGYGNSTEPVLRIKLVQATPVIATVNEFYFDIDKRGAQSPVYIQLDSLFVLDTNIDGVYNRTIPEIPGYKILGYKWDNLPTHANDYITLPPDPTRTLAGNEHRVIYFVYEKLGTPYIDIHGDTKNIKDPIEIDQAYFNSIFNSVGGYYELNSGWYLLTGNVTLTAPLKINGDVKLIIGDGFKLTITTGPAVYAVEVGPGSTFALYSQPIIIGKGELNVSAGNGITIGSYSELINTASIIVTASTKDAVYSNNDGIQIINGVTGHIKSTRYGIFFEGSGGVENYGIIESTNGTGIHSSVILSIIGIINYETGIIKGSSKGIYLDSDDGSSIINYGEIRGTSSNGVGVHTNFDGLVINHEGGLIQGGQNGVVIAAGGTLDNYGAVKATNGILAVGIVGSNFPANIINREGALIEGVANGMRLLAGGTVDNYGEIRGTGSISYGIQTDAVVTINNHAGALIKAVDSSYGIWLSIGGKSTIINSGTITARNGIYATDNASAKVINNEGGLIDGVQYGIRFPVGGEIENYGTIAGLNRSISANSTATTVVLKNAGTLDGDAVLSSGENYVTFVAGSVINGNFNIGSNINSTLTFMGDLPFNGDYIYSTVNGIANIGSAYVSFDKKPDPYSGETIILIDASNGSVSGSPLNSWINVEGSRFILQAEPTQLIAKMGSTVNIVIVDGEGSVEVTDGAGTSYGVVTGSGGLVPIPVGITSITLIGTGINGHQFVSFVIGSADIRVGTVTLPFDEYLYVEAYFSDDLADLLIITLEDKGGAGASHYFTLNGQTYDYTMPFTVRKSSDKLTVSAVAAGAYEFVRWQDSEGDILSTSYATSGLALSGYGSTVTFTSVFAKTGDKVLVELTSDPSGATLYYTIKGLNEVLYTSIFPIDRSETVSVRADSLAGHDFLRWEGPAGIFSYYQDTGVTIPGTGNTVIFNAIYVLYGDLLEITLEQTGGANAKLQYILNGVTYDYNGVFAVRKSVDVLSVSASAYDGYDGIRWQDSEGYVISLTPVSGNLNLTGYKTSVTFTAVFAKAGDRVMVTLISDPNGAALYYTIAGLNEITYAGAFPMARSEGLTVRAGGISSYEFLRWEGPSGIIGNDQNELIITLPAAVANVTYKAVFVGKGDALEIDMDQLGGANAKLQYTLNGVTYDFVSVFTVRKSADVISVSASAYGNFEGIRWQDSYGGIISLTPVSGNIVLKDYDGSVTFTAVFAAQGDRLIVTLTSDPNGASLHYTITGLNEITYAGAFAMARYEGLTLRADSYHDGNEFLRWEGPAGIIDYTQTVGVTLPATGTAVTYNAVFIGKGDHLTITLNQVGGANAKLQYTLNGFTYDFTDPFVIRKSADKISVSASAYAGYDGIRWQDSEGYVISATPVSGILDLSNYDSSVTFTAVFAKAGDRVMITLTSDPSGATLYYTIKGLRAIEYTAPFAMARSEGLAVSAGDMKGYDFLRWDGPAGVVGNLQDGQEITLPSSGTNAAYKAVFVLPEDKLLIDLDQTGNAGATLRYALNGFTYDFEKPFFVRKSADQISTSVSDYGTHIFIRWQDSDGYIRSTNPTSGNLVLTNYGASVTFTAVFAAPGDRVQITLTSDPNGAAMFYTIGSLREIAYTGVFAMERSESLALRAGAHAGYDFLRWEYPNGSIDYAQSTSTSLPAGANVTYKAVYVLPGDKLEIELTQTGGADAKLLYVLNGFTCEYDSMFIVRKSVDRIALSVTDFRPYEFIRWHDDDGSFRSYTSLSDEPDLSKYDGRVTFNVAFSVSGGKMQVTLTSDPNGAALFYTIDGLKEIPYAGTFPMARSEGLSVRAGAHAGYDFLRWEGPAGIFSYTEITNITLPNGAGVSYKAVYVMYGDKLEIDMDQLGGAGAKLHYTLNGITYEFEKSFYVRQSVDIISVSASEYTNYNVIRWQDSEGYIIALTTVSGNIDLSGYDQKVTFTVVLAANGDRVMITLSSDPNGADLYYTIERLREITYTGAFAMARYEGLTVSAGEINGYGFLRWEGPGGIIGADRTGQRITLPVSGTNLNYNAVFVLPNDRLEVVLEQLGGADAMLRYTLNGITYDYKSMFTVRKSADVLSLQATVPAPFNLLRWYDSKDNIVSLAASTGNLNLSGYDASVTFTAVFALSADTTIVTLTSDPNGAVLYFTIEGLNEYQYNGSFLVDKTERFSIRASGTYSGYDFLRWEGPAGIIGFLPTAGDLTVPGGGSQIYRAVYVLPADKVEITLTQTGGANAKLQYTLNGVTYDFVSVFSVRKNVDILQISASEYGSFEFIRWQDSYNNVASADPTIASFRWSEYGSSVTFTAVFAASGEKVMVALVSDPNGATLYYTIAGLNEIRYTVPFAMERTEGLEISAGSFIGYDFLRWEESGGIIGFDLSMIVSLPASGTDVTYTAVYALPDAEVLITLDQIGGAGAQLYYTLNADVFLFTAPFTAIKGKDNVSVWFVYSGDHEFVRWQDSVGDIISTTEASGNLNLLGYGSSVTFYVVFAAKDDRVMVTLSSDPNGAALYFKIEGLNEIAYSAPFAMDRTEVLSIRSASFGGYNFMGWEGPEGMIGDTLLITGIILPDTVKDVAYTAIFIMPGQELIVSLQIIGGDGSTELYYILNNNIYPYTSSFTVRKGVDTVSVFVTSQGNLEFVRWQDSVGNIISSASASSNLDLSKYSDSVVFTAVFAASGERLMVTLTSDPNGAALYYKIGSLNEITYDGPFAIARNESLIVKTDSIHASHGFLRWEGPAGIFSYERSASAALPASGTSVTYKAVFVLPEDKLTIWMEQLGGNTQAKLTYTLNGVTYVYVPFMTDLTVRKSTDVLSIAISDYGTSEFIRWIDSNGNIISTAPVSGNLNLSVYENHASFVGLLALPGDKVMVSLTSDPSGAAIEYEIYGLNKYIYTVPFAMVRSEIFTVYAGEMIQHEFLRWEGPAGIIGSNPVEYITLPGTGTSVVYKAVYVLDTDKLTVKLAQKGNAGAELYYTLNGVTYRFEGDFTVRKSTDQLSTAALNYGSSIFIRWQDSEGYIVSSTQATVNLNLSRYDAVVTFTAVIAAPGDRVMVTLVSDPNGAALYYTIDELREITYSGIFAMERNETLTVRAGINTGYEFLRWEDPGMIRSYEEVFTTGLPGTGVNVTYKAVYALSGDKLEVILTQTGGAGAKLLYILNGVTYDYDSQLTVLTVRKSTDSISLLTSEYKPYEFIRWQDSSKDVISSTSLTSEVNLSKYNVTVTFTAVFAESGDRMMVTLSSDPNGAALYYTITGLNEIEYAGAFAMARSEGLTVKAGNIAGYDFLRWEGPGRIVGYDQADQIITLPEKGTEVAYKAVFVGLNDRLEISLTQTGGANAKLQYTLNGITYNFESTFVVRKSTDIVSVSASDYGNYDGIRWQDSYGNIISVVPVSGDLNLSGYVDSVVFTAVFAAPGDRVMVTLSSVPSGATLYFTIAGLNELTYSGPFAMARSEGLTLRTGGIAGYELLRWEGPAGIFGDDQVIQEVTLPKSGANAAYKAVFVLPTDKLIIELDQTGGANAKLQYTLNGITYDYAGIFVVRQSADVISVSASSYGNYDGIRWQDSYGNIISIVPVSGNLNLSGYTDSVIFTAVFAAPGERVIVTLSSDPNGAALFYTIEGLNAIAYTAPFAMARSEGLTLEAGAVSGYDFLRWEGTDSMISYNQSTSVTLPKSGGNAAYKAVYVLPTDKLIIELDQTGGANAKLQYTLNGITYDYAGIFVIRQSADIISVSASDYGNYDGIRWQDSYGYVISTTPVSGNLNLSGYTDSVIFTAVFAAPGERVMVTLISDPTGAALYYTIIGLNEITYAGTFAMARSEGLTLRAGDISDFGFLRWEGPAGIIGYIQNEQTATLPATGVNATFKAVFAKEGDRLEIDLASIGGFDVKLRYSVNGITYDYVDTFVVRKSTDVVYINAFLFGGFDFIRWSDSQGNVVSTQATSVMPELSKYDGSVTFTAKFASYGDRVQVYLRSDLSNAPLFYTIEGLSEVAYNGFFVMSRSEKLSIRAEDSTPYDFLRWDDVNGKVTSYDKEQNDMRLPGSGHAIYVAVYVLPEDKLEVSLDYTGITGSATMRYTLNGFSYEYDKYNSQPFTIRKSADQLSVSVSLYGSNQFLRWKDSVGDVVSSTPASGNLVMSKYGSEVTFTAMLTAQNNSVTVTLASDPTGAPLYYIIGGLNEIVYNAPFAMSRSEILTLTAIGTYSGHDFLRWEDADGVIGRVATIEGLTMPSTGTNVTYKAIYVLPGDRIEITLTQIGGANAHLHYVLNGVIYHDSLTFTVRKSADVVTILASTRGDYEFIRWQDSQGGIVSSDASVDSPNLSGYGSSVTFTAVFAAPGDKIMVSMTSDPNGAPLYYTIQGLNEIVYDGAFAMARYEGLTLRTSVVHAGSDFLRWEDPKIFSNANITSATLPSTGTDVTYNAVFVSKGDRLEIDLEQLGGAGATLQYTLNGITYDFESKFVIRKNVDIISVSASEFGSFEFIRWQDSRGYVISLNSGSENLNLSGYGSSATLTAVFAPSGDKITVILSSDPEGITLFYTIERLNEALYDGPFVMSRAEKLSLRAVEVKGYDFQEWNGQNGTIGITLMIADISLPADIQEAAFAALYTLSEIVIPGDKYYFINAKSDERTTISPSGTVSVLKGNNMTFYFSADNGFSVSAVIVDGKYLSQEEIDKGYYTFRYVSSNHSIEVLSAISSNVITLTIDVKGQGYAEYSVNGSPFVLYSKAVTLPESANVIVRAFAYEGYEFKEWRMGSTVMTADEIGFTDVVSSIHLVLYFTGENEDGKGIFGGISDIALLLLIAIAFLILATLLLWLVLYKRRTYEVVKVGHSAEIVGKDRARRKKAYRFTIAGGTPGTVFYRVGDGQWKDIIPSANGEYVIPKEDVIDNLAIEQR